MKQSTVRKKMAIGTFTYHALRTKTLLKRANKNTKKNFKSFKLDKSNAVTVGTTANKPHLYICLLGLVWFARYSGKMYSRHLFSYGGLIQAAEQAWYTCAHQICLIRGCPNEQNIAYQIRSNSTKQGVKTVKCLVTKECLIVFGRQTFIVWPGPKK